MLTQQDIDEIKLFLGNLIINYNLTDYDERGLNNVIAALDFIGNVIEKYINLITALATFKNIIDTSVQELLYNKNNL